MRADERAVCHGVERPAIQIDRCPAFNKVSQVNVRVPEPVLTMLPSPFIDPLIVKVLPLLSKVVVTPTDKLTAPSGACRQLVYEFCEEADADIFIFGNEAGESFTLSLPLPRAFGRRACSARRPSSGNENSNNLLPNEDV
jgi:hypothetical protein